VYWRQCNPEEEPIDYSDPDDQEVLLMMPVAPTRSPTTYALLVATLLNLYGVVEHLLVTRGHSVARLVRPYDWRLSALHLAALNDSARLVKLIGSQCNEQQVNAASEFGTALMMTCRAGNDEAVAYLAKRAGVTGVLQVDAHGNTALHYAAQHGSLANIKALVDVGGVALANAKNARDQVAETLARQHGHSDALYWLVGYVAVSQQRVLTQQQQQQQVPPSSQQLPSVDDKLKKHLLVQQVSQAIGDAPSKEVPHDFVQDAKIASKLVVQLRSSDSSLETSK
jgi:hypothetical protein